MKHEKILIGKEEWCAFPQLQLPAIKARIDSGAKTSSLHAFNIQINEQSDLAIVEFDIHPLQRDKETTRRCRAEIVDRRVVKSSSGTRQYRYVIRTLLRLGEHEWPIEVTLTNRDSMGYRMLLGREAMQGQVIIDPEYRFLLGKLRPKTVRKAYDHD